VAIGYTRYMKTYREYITDALARRVAIGHFNISNMEGFWAVAGAARKLNVPVIIGVSEGERDFIGVEEIALVVKHARETWNFPIFLNADHTYSLKRVCEVVDAGYDSVIFDGTELSFEENVKIAQEAVSYMRKRRPGMLLEAELGFIGKSSKVLDAIPENVHLDEACLTKPDDALRFIQETGADMLAPAVGNIHGMLKGGKDPALNIERIKQVSEATKVPLVLHGGSGNSNEDFIRAIDAGVAIIHVNTELRVAYRDGLKATLEGSPDEVAPYKFLAPARNAMQAVVEEKLRVFNKLNA
jgi:fructose-bisphosphate aldolase class II